MHLYIQEILIKISYVSGFVMAAEEEEDIGYGLEKFLVLVNRQQR